MSDHIRFLCPTCKAVMEARVERAGNKINCLKCGQRLQIPPAEHAKTILAPGLGVHEEGAPALPTGDSSIWYCARNGHQFGPFNAEKLRQLAASGQLSTTDLLWKHGMAQWVPASTVKGLFVTTGPAMPPSPGSAPRGPMPAAGVKPPDTAPPPRRETTSGSQPAPKPTCEPPPLPTPILISEAPQLPGAHDDYIPSYDRQSGKRNRRGLIIGLSVSSGVLLIGLIGLVIWGGGSKTTGGGGSKSGGGDDWGSPIRVSTGNREGDGTTFLVGLKDAWWTDYNRFDEKDKKTFVVVYYYKNLGPREGSFWLHRVEIKTDKGHIFSGQDIRHREFERIGPKHDVGGWLPSSDGEEVKIGETGELAVVFNIPKDELPTELIERSKEKWEGEVPDSKRITLDRKLPQRRFGFRRYTEAFGFLPEKAEKAVPGLIEALQDKDWGVRNEAVEALGKIGPAAKDALPALTALARERGPLGLPSHDARKAQEAIRKITAQQ